LLATSCQRQGQETKAAITPSCGLSANQIGTFVAIKGGQFVAGDQAAYPDEGPPQRLSMDGFNILRHEVTNAQFAAFVAATGHVTDAQGGGGAVFTRGGGWALVKGADWRHPDGPKSNIIGKDNWPVVQVSQRDALAYAAWAKARLPDEMEWEYAANLGLPDPANSRSGAKDASGRPRANVWQGLFPLKDEGTDGFAGTAPVGCFPPDKNGLSDMIGNVWEWTATMDPSGQQAIIKGGSHLCADNFCGRYRPQARQSQDTNFSTNHLGFRVVGGPERDE
jgi:formylglycine-generating enzyme required for sulfatase activity